MDELYVNRVMTTTILILLLVLSFFLLKPILVSIIIGIILAFVFNPVYRMILRYTKSRNISASLVIILIVLLIGIPIWFLTPIFVEQSVKIYVAVQQMDMVEILKSLFPSFFASDSFSTQVGTILESFISRTANSLVNSLGDLILNFPTLFLHLTVILFTFFFVLRDQDELILYVKSLMPFSKDVQNKFFKYSEGITSSMIYGQIVIGILQGIIAGLGFFLFGVPNALFLTLLAILSGVLPIIGTALIWLPVSVFLIIGGNTFQAFGVLIFGIISSTVDNFLRPAIVSRKTSIHSSIILIGMIGGLFMFNIIGLILGPLILSYLLIILELYRNKKIPGLFIEEPKAS